MKASELAKVPADLDEITVIGEPMRNPKGWQEQPGGIHLGKGQWVLKYRRVREMTNDKGGA